MCPRSYVFEDHRLISAPEAGVIEKHIIVVVCQVLENIERTREIGAAITEKDSLLSMCRIANSPLAENGKFNLTITRTLLYAPRSGRGRIER
jgi:hypothetical protein